MGGTSSPSSALSSFSYRGAASDALSAWHSNRTPFFFILVSGRQGRGGGAPLLGWAGCCAAEDGRGSCSCTSCLARLLLSTVRSASTFCRLLGCGNRSSAIGWAVGWASDRAALASSCMGIGAAGDVCMGIGAAGDVQCTSGTSPHSCARVCACANMQSVMLAVSVHDEIDLQARISLA